MEHAVLEVTEVMTEDALPWETRAGMILKVSRIIQHQGSLLFSYQFSIILYISVYIKQHCSMAGKKPLDKLFALLLRRF